MTRTILIASVARLQRISFQLKTAGYEVIGTMTLNPATGRHEMELTEQQFLKHAKELARICAIPGMAWYVAEFREHGSGVNTTRQAVDDLAGKPFFALRKMAKGLGVNTDSIKGNDAMKTAIRAARSQAITATQAVAA